MWGPLQAGNCLGCTQGVWPGGSPKWLCPGKKTLNFWLCPSLCLGYSYPSNMVSCLGCPDMSPTTHKKPCISSTLWGLRWEGEVGPHQSKLWTSPLGQPGPRGLEGALLWAPPAPPHCLGRWPLHPPWLTFQGSGALANTPGVATSMLGLISAKLIGDLPQTKEYLPWRQQVDCTVPCEAALQGVNVQNHIQSCWPCTTLANLGQLCC